MTCSREGVDTSVGRRVGRTGGPERPCIQLNGSRELTPGTSVPARTEGWVLPVEETARPVPGLLLTSETERG